MSETHDYSRVDAFMAARRRAMVLHAVWRPMLAGAAGAALVIAAVAVAQPRFNYREVEVPRVTFKDVTVPNIVARDVQVDHVVPKDVEIDIPRIVPPSPLARTPAERSFTSTEDWRAADVRGRIVRETGNGFVLATEDQSELAFHPAKIGPDGKAEPNPAVKDIVKPFLGDLCLCHPAPGGIYECVALHDGREVAIAQTSVGKPL